MVGTSKIDIEAIRRTLIDHGDDERQDLIDELERTAPDTDYSELRRRLIDDLRGEFDPGKAFLLRDPKQAPSIRSWMLSALGQIIGQGDEEAAALFRDYVGPEHEPDEFVRYWALAALMRAVELIPEDWLGANETGGLVRTLHLAIIASRSRDGFSPGALWEVLKTGPRGIYYVLRALRVAAVPGIIGEVCTLLVRAPEGEIAFVPYDALHALAHPRIIDEAAKALAGSLDPPTLAQRFVYAARGSTRSSIDKFGRLLTRLDHERMRPPLEKEAASDVRDWALAARELLQRLGGSGEIPPVAGYISDAVPAEGQVLPDELGIGEDVSTLCSVLLAKDVEPPLAVGLFGDWGTGKSYFMEAMYRHIEDLALRSRSAERSAYYGSVVQIRFNAWHYVDANLWASLVSHIFDQLAEKISPHETPEQTKKRLLQELDSAKQIRAEAVQEKQLAETQKQTAEQALKDAIEARRNKEVQLADLHPSDLLKLLSGDEQKALKSGLAASLQALGVPSAVNSLKELEDAYRQAFSLAGRGQAVVLSFWRARHRKAIVVMVACMFVGVPLASWAFATVLKAPWLGSVNAVMGEAAVVVGGLAAALKKHLAEASGSLATLEEKRNAALEAIRRKQEEKSSQELALQKDLAALRAGEEMAQRRVEEADSKVRELQQKLDDIEAGRSLSKFILERVQAEDYRKYLGIVSTIRKDFERLGTLLKNGQAGMDKVGRLILYIDDLDRCPADKVVEVLQAVHLLLAMPLFVAVVGVDLRWLLRSLEDRFTAFQEPRQELGALARPEWVTSPQNYLEKIFQIPFNLRQMDSGGYEKLVSALLPVRGHEVPAPPAPPTQQPVKAGPSDKPASPAGPGASASQAGLPEAAKVAPAAPPKAPDLNPDSLLIQADERDFAQNLYSFIPTPRAAKRFANVYRLLKAPLAKDALRSFEGAAGHPGEYQAAMLLLAVAVGMSQHADRLFARIMSGGKAGTSWRDLFAEVLPLTAGQKLALSKVRLGEDLYPFQLWAPRVGRFTFETAKSAIGPKAPILGASAASA